MSSGISICVTWAATSAGTSVTYTIPASAAPEAADGTTERTASGVVATLVWAGLAVLGYARVLEVLARVVAGRAALGRDHHLHVVLRQVADVLDAGRVVLRHDDREAVLREVGAIGDPGPVVLHRIHPGRARRCE